MVTKRKLGFGGDVSASYVVPDDATADTLSSIQMRFGVVPKRWILRHVQCFVVGRWSIRTTLSNVLWLVVGFNIRTTFWLQRSREAIGEEDDGRIWIEYYVYFILDFFHV
jgi:hypothetical protein